MGLVNRVLPEGELEKYVKDYADTISGNAPLTVNSVKFIVWEAVKPSSVGIAAWPSVPRGQDWKTGVCRALGWGHLSTGEAWQRILGSVRTYKDLQPELLGAVEHLIDFVTAPG
mgnify:CR=1 FL=1